MTVKPNTLSSNDIIEAAHLCLAVYDDAPDVSGWEPIALDDLDMPEGYEPFGRYVNENAFAFVRTMEVNGEKTLALTFKGTDKWCYRDWKDNVLNINTHYEKLRPLIEALDSYVGAKGIDRVMVMGHSLGGAMASIYLHEHPDTDTGTQYSGVTFGSPGGVFPDEHADRRLVCFQHNTDIVPHIASLRVKVGKGYRSPGRVIEIDDSDETRFKGIFGGVKSHSMREYVETIFHLAKTRRFDLALRADRDLLMLRSDDPLQNCRMRTRSMSDELEVHLEANILSDEEAQALDNMVDKAHEMDKYYIDLEGEACRPSIM